jgi:hypothetical protein
MAIEGIGSLVQILANELRERELNSQQGLNTPGNVNTVATAEDTFTPSAQNNSVRATEQDAGIFQVNQGGLTAVAASALIAQTNPNAAQSVASAHDASAGSSNAGNAQPAAHSTGITPSIPGQLFGPTPDGQARVSREVPATNEPAQIVALNAGLPALGLSKVEIQEIDSIASQIQNFNPATYTNLVNQFEALAQQATGQGAPNPASVSTVSSPNTNTSTKANAAGSKS